MIFPKFSLALVQGWKGLIDSEFRVLVVVVAFKQFFLLKKNKTKQNKNKQKKLFLNFKFFFKLLQQINKYIIHV